jgi:cytochrome bd-type quinol oxidase subunit 1
MVLFAVILFFLIYAAMGIGYIRLLVRTVKKGPDKAVAEGGHS